MMHTTFIHYFRKVLRVFDTCRPGRGHMAVDTRESIRLLMSYGRTEIPVVVINHVKVLDGQDITGERLEEEIGLAEAGVYAGMSKQRGTESLSEYGFLALLFSYSLGVM